MTMNELDKLKESANNVVKEMRYLRHRIKSLENAIRPALKSIGEVFSDFNFENIHNPGHGRIKKGEI